MLKNRVHISTLCLVTIGLFDLVTTILLMENGMFEANPLFDRLLDYGMLAFAAGKVVMLAGPILILEFARKPHPRTAEYGTWLAFILYTLFYISHLVGIRG